MSCLNVKAVVAAFNQEKALVGAFSVIVQPLVEPMDRFAALIETVETVETQFNGFCFSSAWCMKVWRPVQWCRAGTERRR